MYYWDPKKSILNKKKHGISFEEARHNIFENNNVLAFDVAYDKYERRHAVIGKYKGKYYVSIFTIRNDGIRIISARRARREEEKEAKLKGI